MIDTINEPNAVPFGGSSSSVRDFVIDMTPTCINRTAIYHIALDTAAHLNDVTLAWQYRGECRPKPSDRDAERELQQAFFQDVGRWGAASVHIDEVMETDARFDDKLRRLYFDPIYTLYRPLAARDVVFVLDLSPLTNPEWHNNMVSKVYERAFRRLLSSQARLVSISENCTATLRANFAIPAQDIVTVPLYLRDLGSDGTEKPAADLQPKRFLLFVGSLEARKNLVGLIQAFALSGLEELGWKLALAGGDGQGSEAIKDAAGGLLGVEILGFVSDAELAWLYENAAAFIYPSYLEGFGLPLLEAMARGLPCVASLTGASSEICRDLGVLVDPYDMQSIIAGMLDCIKFAKTMTQGQRAKLVARAKSFSFERYMDALYPVLA